MRFVLLAALLLAARTASANLVDQGPQPVAFARFDVELTGAEVGDVLDADGAFGDGVVHVVAQGACPAFVAPPLACAEPLQGCADAGIGDEIHPPHSSGCSTGGAGGLGTAVALLALRRRRISSRLVRY